MINVGQAIGYLDLDTSKFSKGLSSAFKELDIFKDKTAGVGEKISAVGDTMAGVGSTMTRNLTVPIVGAGVVVGKFAADFEQGIAKVSTIADTSVVPIEKISQGVLDISKNVGISTGDLTEAMYQVISATNDTGNSLGYVEAASKLAKGGFTDVTSAINGVTAVMNAYGMQGPEAFQKVSDAMITTQNLGKTTVDELAQSLFNVIPMASAAGISFEEVGASIATLTAQGRPTAVVTTQLRAAMQAFIQPNAEMAAGLGAVVEQLIKQGKLSGQNADNFVKFSNEAKTVADRMAELAAAGKTNTKEYKELNKTYSDYEKALTDASAEMGVQVIKSEGLQGSLKLLSDSVGGSSNKLGGMLGSVEAVSAAMSLTSDIGNTKFNSFMTSMQDTAGATEKAFETMSDTTTGTFQKLKASGEQLAISFGTLMLPLIQQLANWVQGLVDWLNSLDEGTKSMILTVLGVVAAVGPLLLILGKVTSAVGSIITIIPKIAAAFQGFAISPAGAVMLAIAAIAALVAIISSLPTEMEKVNAATLKQVEAITPWSEALKAAKGTIMDVNTMISSTGRTMIEVEDDISKTEAAITEVIKKAITENGALRDEDIRLIEEYQQKLKDLNQEKLDMYVRVAAATAEQIKTELATNKELTEQQQAELMAQLLNANAQLTQARTDAENAEIQQLMAKHEQLGTLNSSAYQTELAAITSHYDSLELESDTHYGAMASDIADYNDTTARLNESGYEEMSKSKEAAIKLYDIAQKRIDEINNMDIFGQIFYSGELRALQAMQNAATDQANAKNKELYDKRNADVDEAYLNMLALKRKEGVELSDQEKQNVKDILYAWSDMPDTMEGEGRDAMLGLFKGLEGQIPGVVGLSDMSTRDILSTIEKGFDIKGYSKKTEKIGGQVTTGLSDGMDGKLPTLLEVAKNIANSVLTAIKNLFGIKSPSKEGKAIGSNVGESVASGLLSQLDSVKKAAKKVGDTALKELDSSSIDYGFNINANSKASEASGGTQGVRGGVVNNNTFTIHSNQPLSALEAANEFEKMMYRFAEGV